MTSVRKFEAWVSDNYERLVEDANRITSGHPQTVDCLHELIEDMIENPGRIPEKLRVVVFSVAVKNRVRNTIKHELVEARVAGEVGESIRLIGQDETFSDRSRAMRQRADRGRKARKRSAVSGVQGVDIQRVIEGRPEGIARWRYQTLRDDRLFEARALASQWESLWAAATRPVYGLERGVSYTEFGPEVTR